MSQHRQQVPIAVVGLSAIFPGSIDRTGFWHDILAGNDLITDVPASHWLIEDYYDPDPTVPDMTYAKRGAFLKEVDFDALTWGVPPHLLPQTDTVQLLALIAAKRVLEDATAANHTVDKDRVSVILGITSGQDLLGKMVSRLQHPIWRKALREMGLPETEVEDACKRIAAHYSDWEESTFPGLLGNVVAGRIANRLDLGGTNCVTDAACASTFSAISMAVNELTLHQSDLVISGGCDTMNDIFMYMCFSKTPALSPTGDCAPFSDKADGTLLGEGLGMVALKRLEDAERDGDTVYAVLKGVGSSSDGRSKSVYAPRPSGQAKAIQRAYQIAGYPAETVELIEAHGTGTKAGDAAEFEGLRIAFADAPRGRIGLGTVKSQIGHTKAAAGAAGLFKAVMALHHKVLPPTIKVDQPNPNMDIGTSAFYLNTEARPWIRASDHPRRVGVSSFGFGGSNFHLAVEEYTGDQPAGRIRTMPSELVVLSADTPAEVVTAANQMADALVPGALTSVAFRSTQAPTKRCRLAVVARDEAALGKSLRTAVKHIEANGEAELDAPNGISWRVDADPGDVALLFPGQGSQYLKMGSGLAMHYAAFREAFDAAADLELAETPLHDVVYPAPVFSDAERDDQHARLTCTEWAQPAIGAHSLGCMNLLSSLGVQGSSFAGHSFGEVIALHAGGAFTADDALRIARKRGELMAAAADRPGSMLAIPLTIDEVRAVLDEVGGAAVVANHNSPRQVVVSGPTDDVEAVEKALLAKGVEPKMLQVATAFHSSVVSDSTKPFSKWLKKVEIHSPALPVYANSTAAPYEDVLATLGGQIAKPVRFVEQIDAMYEAGVRTFIECGPGNVLSNLTRQILDGRDHNAISLDRKRKQDVTAFHLAMAKLFTAGVDLDLSALWAGFEEPVDPREIPAAKMPVAINGSNYGQPYPPPGGAADLPPPNGPRPEKERIVYVESQSTTAPREVTMSQHPNPPGASSLWVTAFAEAQQQTAQAHTAYQNAMASSHQAYLRTVETSFQTLSALASGAPMSAPTAYAALPVAPPVVVAALAPVAMAPPVVLAAPAPAIAAPVAPMPVVATSAPVAAPVPVAAPMAPAGAVDLNALLMDVVADKTGYPAEMLNLEMTLEGDLGIDSIKRVEILSAMREREPTLPEVDAAEMAQLATLGQIVAYMDATGSAAAAPAPSAPAPSAPAASTGDLKTLLMDVVAEKTGYPAEMLNLEMTLEGDLGIDSIKRVEILSAMREREPTLPEVDAAEMAQLATLGQIVAYMDDGAGTANPSLAQPAPSSAELGPTPGRYALELVDAPALGMSQPGLDNGVVVVGDDRVGPELVEALLARGVDAQYGVVPSGTRALVYLGGLAHDASPASGREVAREAFLLAHNHAESLSAGLFVTVQDTGGDFGLSGSERAWLGSLPGLTKTAAQEWPGSTKAIDILTEGLSAEAIADQLADELISGGVELEVALSDRRRTLRSVKRDAQGGPIELSADSVVVVSGGGRGVTAATVIALAGATESHFVLLGRTALSDEPACCAGAATDPELKRALLIDAKSRGEMLNPADLGRQVKRILANREIRGTLASIEAVGGSSVYRACDITDVAGLQVVLEEARQHGPIHGFIHGAGVLADKRIAEKTPEQFDFVFDTKIGGLRALLDATGDDDLKIVALFSSVAARCGNQGQCDYAMANEVLNKVAHLIRSQRPSCVVKSFGWGPWDGGMVTPALKKHFQSLGVPLIPLAAGAQMLVDELGDHSGDDEIVLGGEPRPEPLAAAAGPLSNHLAVKVDSMDHAWLEDHAIDGTAIVPVVLALEWFARAARSLRPDLQVEAVEDVKVLRGIRIHDLEVGIWLQVRCTQIENGAGSVLSAEVCNDRGHKHYTANIRMVEKRISTGRPAVDAKLEPYADEVYDGSVLFHGDAFQVIDSVIGVGDEGIDAIVQGTAAKEWNGAWCTDPAAFDGGLQLALIWSKHVLGGPSLPTAVSSLKTYQTGPAQGPLICRLRGTKKSKNRALADLVFTFEDGTVFAELLGVETHLRPDHS